MAEQYDYNYLKGNGFAFGIQRIPQTTFRVVNGELPSIAVPPPPAGDIGTTQYFAGSNVEFEPLLLEFIVDDDLLNYEEIYQWLTAQQFESRGKKSTPADEKGLYSDGVLVTMNKSSNANRVFQFKDMFPIMLGSLRFDTTSTSAEPVTCQVTFRYSYFTMLPLGDA